MVIVFLAGNLGADPEVRFSASGQKIVSLRVASNSKRQGKDETTWWRVTIFGDRFDKMLTYLKKGSAIVVTGEMSTSLWTDKEGRQHIQHEVIADSIKFSPFGRSDRPQEQGGGHQQNNNYNSSNNNANNSNSYATPNYSQNPAFSTSNSNSNTQDFSLDDMMSSQENSDNDPPF